MRTILLHYGERARLRAGLEQARSFGHPVTLLAGRRSATRGLRTHSSPLVDVAAEPGRAGLLAVLDGLPDDEGVLLLHDDVLLQPDGAELLLAAVSGSRIVVPSSNQADADGYVGALPPDVAQPVRQGALAVGEAFRTSCLAASAGRMRTLALHSITTATGRIHLPDGSVMIHHGVVATHLDSCRDQLEEPTGPDGRPLLVASMIVRDEEDFLPDCLASLDGLVDRIDICDTGSTDRTVEIARSHGAQVIQREWRDDFAWARNQALELSRDAWWVLQIDADERATTEDVTGIRARLATMLTDREGLRLPLTDIDDHGGRVRTQHLPRLFPGEGTEYVGRLHEIAYHPSGRPYVWNTILDLELLHLGYQASVWSGRDKQDRNLQLARAMHAEKDSLTSAYQLARSLPRTEAGHREVVELLHARLEEARHGPVAGEGKHSRFNDDATAEAYSMLATSMHALGRSEAAWDVAIEARRRFPTSIPLRRTVSQIGLVLGRFDDVIESSSAPITVHGTENRDSKMESWTSLDLVEAHLATGRIDEARAAIERLLAEGLPRDFPRWKELVSAIALSCGDDAVDVLLTAAARDRSGNALFQAGLLMDPPDACEFAAEVALRDELTDDQASAGLELLLRHDSPQHLATFLDHVDPPPADWDVRHIVDRAKQQSAELLVQRFGIDLESDVRMIELASQLAPGDAIPEDLVRQAAADESGRTLQAIVRNTAIEVAAAITAAVLETGTTSLALLKVALATCSLSGDDRLLAALEPHLHEFDVEQVDRALTAAATKGHDVVSSAFARALLARRAAQAA